MKHTRQIIIAGTLMMSASVVCAQTATTAATPVEAYDSIVPGYTDLDEIVISAKKDIIKSDGAKLTYDLEEDDSSKGTSVLEALKKVPMLSVDGDDNIRVKGDSNFKIYVNGKEEPMLTANAKTILKAMPAESISKIEVITEPGAKYDAEGTAGIINLITERKQTKDGYAGTLSANIGTQNEGLSAYGRVKKNKVTADANINYSDNYLMKRANTSHQETINFKSEDAYETLQRTSQKIGFHYIGGGLNTSWEPDDKDLFTLSANVYSVEAGLDKMLISTSTFTKAGALSQAYTQSGDGGLKNLAANTNAGYKRIFGDPGHFLTAAYGFNYGRDNMNISYENDRELNADYIPAFEKNFSTGYTREHIATVDYTNPLKDEKHTLETGVKGVFRRNTANSGQSSGDNFDNLVENPGNTTLTKQLQDIYAAYISYGGNFDKIAVKAGLRYEHTRMGMEFTKGEGTNYQRHLNDLAPNAALTWIMGPATNLRLAYQMRITRPNLSQMNPYKFQIMQTEVRMGNPDLESERYHNLTLTYTNYGRTLGGNISLEGSQSNNTIEEYVFYDRNIQYQTYANMGHKQRIGLNGFLNWNITNSMSIGINGSVHYTVIKSGDKTLSNHGWNGNYGMHFNYTGPWKLKYSLYGGQSTGEIALQSKWYGWYYYGLGISRSFLKNDALTLSLNASNFLTKNTFFKTKIQTADHLQRATHKNPNWNVGLSISWNFGHLTDQVKKTGANLENTDTKSDNKGGGGGIGL